MNVPARGADLFCSMCGSGPVCLVPTSIGTAPYERLTPSPLDERFRLVIVDLRGSGRSTGAATDLTFDVLAEDLEAVRRALGVERVTVLGHSMLGALAIEYARRCPSTVSHVIAAGTPPHGDMKRLAALSSAYFEQDASEDRKQALRENLERLPAGATAGQRVLAQTPMRFFDARFDAAPVFAAASPSPALLQHVLGSLLPTWDVTVNAGSLRVPIFLAHGRYDYSVPHVAWRDAVTQLPLATLRIFTRSGHQPFFEEPEAFADAVTAWMASTPARSQTPA
jgi:proline iminopeptidase